MSVLNCDQCEAATINGIFCHETECPNSRKTWVEDCGWILFHDCQECGNPVEEGNSCNCQEVDILDAYVDRERLHFGNGGDSAVAALEKLVKELGY